MRTMEYVRCLVDTHPVFTFPPHKGETMRDRTLAAMTAHFILVNQELHEKQPHSTLWFKLPGDNGGYRHDLYHPTPELHYEVYVIFDGSRDEVIELHTNSIHEVVRAVANDCLRVYPDDHSHGLGFTVEAFRWGAEYDGDDLAPDVLARYPHGAASFALC